jgi:hypothetical protein
VRNPERGINRHRADPAPFSTGTVQQKAADLKRQMGNPINLRRSQGNMIRHRRRI